MPVTVSLQHVTREDVHRLQDWLENDEMVESWFGRYSYGDPAHLGYHPERVADMVDAQWNSVFEDPEHRIMSVYTREGEHIGELHVAIEEALADGQISILIGRKDKWHEGYGTAAVKAGLQLCFDEWALYRVWADIPEYNTHARAMFEHLGFKHEGTLRQSRPHEGARFDSVVVGILATEYATQSSQHAHRNHHV